MWRAFFMAVGLAAVILGGEMLLIDKATLTLPAEEPLEPNSFMSTVHETFYTKDFVPPEHAPWTLLSVGAVVFLYSHTAPRD